MIRPLGLAAAPVRLRLSRAKGFSLQAFSLATNGLTAINVARPTRWGNPYPITPEVSDQRTADMRDAALLNAIAVAKAHGMSPEWTEADVARWRYMRTMTDAIAAGANEGEALPQGFGPAVRARQTEVLLRIATKATAFVPEQETSR
jgi:hypothetical protein